MIRATGPNLSNGKGKGLYALKHHAHKKKATSSAIYAIVMWRVASYLLFLNPSCMSLPVEQFLSYNGASDAGIIEFESVSDASPYRVCAAIYHHDTHLLIGWTSILLPYPEDVDNRFQCSREYLGLIISFLLIGNLFPSRVGKTANPPIPFKWINDNTGALAWADKNKASSLTSIAANMIITTLQITSNITLLGSEHLPGLQMGEIDHESRREDHIRVGDYSTPTLLPELFINLESNSEIMAIISD